MIEHMAELDPTYVFEGDQVIAMHEGSVIAQGPADQVERVESDATAYLEGLEIAAAEKKRTAATHIVTPNGLKGKILNRVASLWGEDISVKFENGEHATFTVTAGNVADWVTEMPKTAGANKLSALNGRLDAPYDLDLLSLRQRFATLHEVADEAADTIRMGASDGDSFELDRIRLIALGEAEHVQQAIENLETADIEPYAPPAHIPVPQADLGRAKGDSWLETVAEDMVAESEGQDFEKTLVEDPALLALELDTPVLADQGVARDMALAHIKSKTAGFIGEEVERYRDRFLARFEAARRAELALRQEDMQKEASVEQKRRIEAPDEALFT